MGGGGGVQDRHGQRNMQPGQPYESVEVGGIKNDLSNHVLHERSILKQKDTVGEQQRQAEILEVEGVRSYLATIRQDTYVLGVVDSVLAVEAEERFYDT